MIATNIMVVGGGIVGSAISFGLAKAGQSALMPDGDDKDFRAARSV
jgi:glycine/D-amino acid oxidase-like deaminating enzyme